MVCAVVEDDVAVEADSLAKATDDIGYDDISDDELDDLIEAAEDEQDEKPTESIGRYIVTRSVVIIIIGHTHCGLTVNPLVDTLSPVAWSLSLLDTHTALTVNPSVDTLSPVAWSYHYWTHITAFTVIHEVAVTVSYMMALSKVSKNLYSTLY